MHNKAYLIAFQTIIIREIRRFFRMWTQTILLPIITTVLYLMIFGKVMGPRIGTMNDFNYISYITPGLIMMGIITNAYSNVAFSFYLSKFSRSIEELLIAPIPSSLVALGYICGGAIRGLVVGTTITLTALFFSPITFHHIFITLLMASLASLLFATIGLINGIFSRNFDDTALIPTFVLTPLIYLGGIFYSIDLLPPFWHHLTLFNPILYIINVFRYGMLGSSDVNIWLAILITLVIFVGLFATAVKLLNKGVGIKT